jgi:xylulokinase
MADLLHAGGSVSSADDRFAFAIDLGTTGLKMGLVSLSGRVVWTDDSQLTTTHIDGGGAEQDASRWWTLIGDGIRKGLASGVVAPDAIVAISTTGQWSSTVPVAADGSPVGPCILWMDTRGGRHIRKQIGGRVVGYRARAIAAWIRKTGAVPSSSGSDPIGHMLYLDNDCPEIASKARWYLEPVDYVSMRFTGEAIASAASMTGVWLTDNRKLDRLGYDAGLIRVAGVDAAKLPPLRPTGSVIGTVLPSVASELGLADGVKVVAGTPDLHSAAVGSGTLGDYECHMAISTTSWISCPVDFKKTDVTSQIASVPGASADRYILINNHDTSGACLQWMRDMVVAPSEPRPSFEDLGAAASAVPPGAGGVIFTPWLTGERSPVDDRNARAGFHNLSIQTDQAAMVRAVLEGVAYNDRWLLDAVEKFVKRKISSIRVFGGGAVSDLWCQIHADVMDRTIERTADPMHTGIRGAAMLAGLALGDLQRSEIHDLVKIDATFTPDPANRAVYDKLYDEFPKLYRAQKDMFRRLNRSKRS